MKTLVQLLDQAGAQNYDLQSILTYIKGLVACHLCLFFALSFSIIKPQIPTFLRDMCSWWKNPNLTGCVPELLHVVDLSLRLAQLSGCFIFAMPCPR